MSLPWKLPGRIAPPYTKIEGMFSRAIDMMQPGMFLSHAATVISPSMLSPKHTVSMESAMTSRLTSEAFMPSVPIEMPSLTVMVPNMNGTLSAAQTPSFTRSAIRVRWTLHGVTSLARFATPTKGFPMSSSRRPTARSIARAGARSGPRLRAALFFFNVCRSAAMVICGLPSGLS